MNELKFDLQRFADTTYLKDNLAGFVPKVLAADIIKDVTRGSSVNEALQNRRVIVCNMTVEEVAEQADIPVRTYYSFESGEREPSISNAIKVSNALGITDYRKFKKLWEHCTIAHRELINRAGLTV